MDIWEKSKALTSIVSAVVIPIVLLWIGNDFSQAIKERELQGKFVELAVQILREQPGEQAQGLREWATQVLNNYSGVHFSSETQKALIEDLPLPSGKNKYEGRRDLGNVEEGDGPKFVGRGYLSIVGRENYQKFSKLTGTDLISYPERAEQPEVAATILALWFKERESKFTEALERNDQQKARRIVNGGVNGLTDVVQLYDLYLSVLEKKDGELELDSSIDSQWRSIHIPTILSALAQHQVSNNLVKAYALATADHETNRGKFMREITR